MKKESPWLDVISWLVNNLLAVCTVLSYPKLGNIIDRVMVIIILYNVCRVMNREEMKWVGLEKSTMFDGCCLIELICAIVSLNPEVNELAYSVASVFMKKNLIFFEFLFICWDEPDWNKFILSSRLTRRFRLPNQTMTNAAQSTSYWTIKPD